MKFVLKSIPKMDELNLTRILFFYSYNTRESQERFTHPNFFKDFYSLIYERMKILNISSVESCSNISRSIGTILYKDESVVQILSICKKAILANPSLNSICFLHNACINLKCVDEVLRFKKDQSISD